MSSIAIATVVASLLTATIDDASLTPPATAATPATPATSTNTTSAPANGEAGARAPLRIAVYELALANVDPKVGRIVTDAIVAELRKLQRVSVVSMDEVRAMLSLEAAKQSTGCTDASCLAEIAEALGVDGVVIGNLAVVDGNHIFQLKRIDQREAKTLGTVNQRLEDAHGEEWLAAIGPAVAALFPEHPLRPGQQRGVPKEIALKIHPPPLPTWVFWSSSAATGLALTGAAAAGVFNRLEKARLDDFTASAKGKPIDGAVFVEHADTIANTAYTSWALLGGAVVGGAATGIVSLFTDWNADAAVGAE